MTRRAKAEWPLPHLADGSLPTVRGRVTHPDVGPGVIAFTIPVVEDKRFIEWQSVVTPEAGGLGRKVRTKEVHPLPPDS